jgi:hypothetical protein
MPSVAGRMMQHKAPEVVSSDWGKTIKVNHSNRYVE